MYTGSRINDRELILTRVLSTSPQRAFEAWTDLSQISRWWGPIGFTTTTHSRDLRPGGRWRFTMHGPDGRDYENMVEFLEVAPPSLLSYRHRDEGEVEPVKFYVTVTFAPLGDKTLLTIRSVFESPEDLSRIEDAYGASEGLHQTTARFAECLAKMIHA